MPSKLKEKEYQKQYYLDHREQHLEYGKQYRFEHKAILNQKDRERYWNSKEFRLKQSKESRQRNIDKVQAYDRKRHDIFIDKVMAYFGRSCLICGVQDVPEIYDVHHVDPLLKEYTIGSMSRKDWDTVVVPELEKCCLLCAACHRKIHKGRFNEDINTGKLILTPGKVKTNEKT
jgi:predicted HNH restriction endonuclease